MKQSLLLPLLLPLSLFSQSLTPFPDPWPGANKTTVATDSAGGKSYFTTAQSFNPHNRWKLFSFNHVSLQFDSLAGSGFGPARVTNKMIYNNGKLFLLDNKTELRCFDIQSGSWLWTAAVDNPGWERIHDFDILGDTVFMAGDFSGINGTPRWSIAAFHISAGSVITSWDPSQNGLYDFTGVLCLRVSTASIIYAGGSFLINGKQNLLGIDIASEAFLSWTPQPNDSVYDLEISGDQLYAAGKFTNIHSSARNRLARISLLTHTLSNFSMGANGTIDDIEWYPGQLILNGAFSQIGSQARSGLGAISLLNNQPTAWNPGSFPRTVIPLRLLEKLFITRTDLPTWNVFCFPPALSAGFTQYDLQVCPGDSVAYVVDPGWYASNFIWSYSGSGVSLFPSGNQCIASFSSTASPGSISVMMGSSCGVNASPVTIAISIAQVPAVFAGLDDTLTCAQNTTVLTGNNPSGCISWWNGPLSCSSCISIPVYLPGNYIYIVEDSITGCRSQDTLVVGMDTTRPLPLAPTGPFQVGCGGAPVLLDGSTSCIRCSLTWHDASNQNMQPDPASYPLPGNYFLVAADTVNGCRDSVLITIGLNAAIPNSLLPDLPNVFPSAASNFTCSTDSILLTGGSDTANTIFSWRNISTLQLFSNPHSATVPGIYKLIVTRTDNQCADSSLFVLLGTDTAVPLVNLPALSFTCSDDSLLLSAQIISPNTTVTWTDSLGNSFPDPAWIYFGGKFYMDAIRQDNSCVIRDSILINEVPVLLFFSRTDSLLCRNSQLILRPDPVGGTAPWQYVWNNGSVTDSLHVFILQDSVFWVDVTDNLGCTGRDSFIFSVPQEMQAIIQTYASCNGSDSGAIYIQMQGGIPPYIYSCNGSQNFQSSNYFQDIPFGSYALEVRDSLGCVFRDTVILNSSASPPEVHFLMTEILYAGDTIQAVDLSLPIPDSVHWSLNGPVFALSPDSSLFVLEDSGNLAISLTLFHPGCQLTQTRNFRIALPDSSLADAYNVNGIQEFRIFPNPNTGNFTIEVALAKKQDLALCIYDPSGVMILSQSFRDAFLFQSILNWSDPSPGVYRVLVIAEFDMETKAFIIDP